MLSQKTCSKTAGSPLLRWFVQRSRVGPKARPEHVMSALVESVRRKRTRSLDKQLDLFLQDRNVTQIDLVSDLSCDGLIEPLGSSFGDGFRLRLKKSASEARNRFTVAHEACHTFFYELVPEIKFAPHGLDAEEE